MAVHVVKNIAISHIGKKQTKKTFIYKHVISSLAYVLGAGLTEGQARARVAGNDRPNAEWIMQRRLEPDMYLRPKVKSDMQQALAGDGF